MLSVKDPPIRGPNTEDIPKIIPKIAEYVGLLWRGTRGMIMIMAPANTPADPNPAIARPIIKDMELGAAPQIADPTSKIRSVTRNVHLVENI